LGHGTVSVPSDPAKTLSQGRTSGIVPSKTSEEVKVLVRLVGVAALVAAGLVIAYDMNSGPSYSDGPMPSVRDALACDGRVHTTRQSAGGAQSTWEPAPEAALQSGLLRGEQWWLETEVVRVRARTDDRTLFVYDVAGRARFAAVVERGSGGHESDWRLASWAMCDPAELTDQGSDRLGYGVWLDASGSAVPSGRVMTLHGSERCGWKDVTFIEVNRDADRPLQLVHDPSGSLDRKLLSTYDEHVTLPSDAQDTGWRRGGLALWLQPFGDAAYLVNLADPTDVQRWPRARKPITCE
jgi:hypothetical protein